MNFEGGKEMLEKKHTKMNDEEKNDWEKLTIGLKMTMMTNPKKNDLFGRPIEFCRHFFPDDRYSTHRYGDDFII